MPRLPLYRRSGEGLRSYLKTCNMDMRDGIRPSPRVVRVKNTSNSTFGEPGPSICRWIYPSTGTIARPFFSVYDRLCVAYAGGETGVDLNHPIVDVCLADDAAAGTPLARLVVSYGAAAVVSLTNADGTPQGSPDAYLGLMAMSGGKFYAQTDQGVFNASQISICPGTSNPGTASNYGNGYAVGSPAYAINSLRPLRDSVVAGKPEGAYLWSEKRSAFDNFLTEYIFAPHSDNCKGMFPTANGLAIPLSDGTLLHFDGYSVTDISPRLGAYHHRNNPHVRSRITAGCYANGSIYVATAPWEANWTQEFGLTLVNCVTGGPTYTDRTTTATDGKLDTSSTIVGLVNGDYVYVGASVPFEGVKFAMGTNASAGTHGRVQYYGSGGWTNIGDAGEVYTNTFQDGLYFAKSGFVFWRDFYTAHSSMVAATLDAATGHTTGISGAKYWVRFPITATIVAGTIAEIFILPSRPPISGEAGLAYTGPDNAGRFAHILVGRPGGGGMQWDDLYALPVDSEIKAMAYTELDMGQTAQNAGPLLMMVGQHSRFYGMLGSSQMPGTPVNENYAAGNQVGTPVVYLLPTDLSDSQTDRATLRKKANEFHVYGEYIDSDDQLAVHTRWDHGQWASTSIANTSPTRLAAPQGNQGLELEVALSLEDGAVEMAGPRVTRIDVDFTDLDPDDFPFDLTVQDDAVAPELE